MTRLVSRGAALFSATRQLETSALRTRNFAKA
jgi:hypothetical protein